MPPDPAIGGAGPHAGAVPDGAVGRSGPGTRTGNRRRRLHDQALQPARADRAREGPSAPRGNGYGAGIGGNRRVPLGSHGAARVPGRARDLADLHRVQPAGVFPHASGARLQPRSASGSGVGRVALRHAAHRGCAHTPPAGADRRAARQPSLPDHSARFWLPFRRIRGTGRVLNMTARLFLKLSAGVFCLLFLALVTVDYFATNVAKDNYIQNLTGQLTDKVRMLALALDTSETPDVDRVRRMARAAGGRITVVRADGKVLVDSEADAAGMENHRTRPELVQAFRGESGSDIRQSATVGVSFLYVAVPVAGGSTALRIAFPLRAEERRVGKE